MPYARQNLQATQPMLLMPLTDSRAFAVERPNGLLLAVAEPLNYMPGNA